MTEDIFPDSERISVLGRTAHHEGKLIVGAVLTASPERAFTPTEIYREITRRLPFSVDWRITHRLVHKYLTGNFDGLVTEKSSDKPPRFQAKKDMAGKALALYGAVMDWSLAKEQEDISIVHLLGMPLGKGGIRGSEMRYRLYRHLILHPESATPKEVYKSYNMPEYPINSLREQLRQLRQMGVLSTTRLGPRTSEIHLLPPYQDSIAELVVRVESLVDPKVHPMLQEIAKNTLADRDKMTALIGKVVHFSPYMSETRGEIPLKDVVVDIVNTWGRVTIDQVLVRLQDRGRIARKTTITHTLASLVEDSQLTVESGPHESENYSVFYYSPIKKI